MDKRLFFPATKRNFHAISQVLKDYIPKKGAILEIASGSGEHAVGFQKLFPNILWQASDPDPIHRQSIISWIVHEKLQNKMPYPINLNVEKDPWPIPLNIKSKLKAIICINLIHISPWSCTERIFENSNLLLANGSHLIIYGPFKVKGKFTSESNALFDQSLREGNKEWGLKNIEEVSESALRNNFDRIATNEMPANNISIIFRKNKL